MKTDTSWLNTFRQSDLTHFEQTSFPSQRLEDWRYTNVSAIEKKQFALASQVFESGLLRRKFVKCWL